MHAGASTTAPRSSPNQSPRALIRAAAQAQTAVSSCKVRVAVSIKKEVQFGEHIVLQGSPTELGQWKAEASRSLTWTPGHIWEAAIDLPPGQHEFKCVAVRGANEVIAWEQGPNRVLQVPQAADLLRVQLAWDQTSHTDVCVLTSGSRIPKSSLEHTIASSVLAKTPAETQSHSVPTPRITANSIPGPDTPTSTQEEALHPRAAWLARAPASTAASKLSINIRAPASTIPSKISINTRAPASSVAIESSIESRVPTSSVSTESNIDIKRVPASAGAADHVVSAAPASVAAPGVAGAHKLSIDVPSIAAAASPAAAMKSPASMPATPVPKGLLHRAISSRRKAPIEELAEAAAANGQPLLPTSTSRSTGSSPSDTEPNHSSSSTSDAEEDGQVPTSTLHFSAGTLKFLEATGTNVEDAMLWPILPASDSVSGMAPSTSGAIDIPVRAGSAPASAAAAASAGASRSLANSIKTATSPAAPAGHTALMSEGDITRNGIISSAAPAVASPTANHAAAASSAAIPIKSSGAGRAGYATWRSRTSMDEQISNTAPISALSAAHRMQATSLAGASPMSHEAEAVLQSWENSWMSGNLLGGRVGSTGEPGADGVAGSSAAGAHGMLTMSKSLPVQGSRRHSHGGSGGSSASALQLRPASSWRDGEQDTGLTSSLASAGSGGGGLSGSASFAAFDSRESSHGEGFFRRGPAISPGASSVPTLSSSVSGSANGRERPLIAAPTRRPAFPSTSYTGRGSLAFAASNGADNADASDSDDPDMTATLGTSATALPPHLWSKAQPMAIRNTSGASAFSARSTNMNILPRTSNGGSSAASSSFQQLLGSPGWNLMSAAEAAASAARISSRNSSSAELTEQNSTNADEAVHGGSGSGGEHTMRNGLLPTSRSVDFLHVSSGGDGALSQAASAPALLNPAHGGTVAVRGANLISRPLSPHESNDFSQLSSENNSQGSSPTAQAAAAAHSPLSMPLVSHGSALMHNSSVAEGIRHDLGAKDVLVAAAVAQASSPIAFSAAQHSQQQAAHQQQQSDPRTSEHERMLHMVMSPDTVLSSILETGAGEEEDEEVGAQSMRISEDGEDVAAESRIALLDESATPAAAVSLSLVQQGTRQLEQERQQRALQQQQAASAALGAAAFAANAAVEARDALARVAANAAAAVRDATRSPRHSWDGPGLRRSSSDGGIRSFASHPAVSGIIGSTASMAAEAAAATAAAATAATARAADVAVSTAEAAVAAAAVAVAASVPTLQRGVESMARIWEEHHPFASHSPSANYDNLRLIASAHMIPHIDKVAKGGEDAYFISDEGYGAVGVADGVSGWADEGIDPAEYPRQLMEHAKRAYELATASPCVPRLSSLAMGSLDSVIDVGGCNSSGEPDAREIIRYSQERTMMQGSSTVTLAVMLPGGRVQVANVGDSGVRLLRDGRIVFASEPQQHAFNMPYQLSHPLNVDGPDSAEDADVAMLSVQPDDLLLLATDGLFDNLFDSEIEDIVASHLAAAALAAQAAARQCSKSETVGSGGGRTAVAEPPAPLAPQRRRLTEADTRAMCVALAERAHVHARNPMRRTPWSVAASTQHGFQWSRVFLKGGGKMDDCTVLIALVSEADD